MLLLFVWPPVGVAFCPHSLGCMAQRVPPFWRVPKSHYAGVVPCVLLSVTSLMPMTSIGRKHTLHTHCIMGHGIADDTCIVLLPVAPPMTACLFKFYCNPTTTMRRRRGCLCPIHPRHTPMPTGHHCRPLPPTRIVLLAAAPTIVPFFFYCNPSTAMRSRRGLPCPPTRVVLLAAG